jgi:hypothetical protein
MNDGRFDTAKGIIFGVLAGAAFYLTVVFLFTL